MGILRKMVERFSDNYLVKVNSEKECNNLLKFLDSDFPQVEFKGFNGDC
jgi:hypothetical protein